MKLTRDEARVQAAVSATETALGILVTSVRARILIASVYVHWDVLGVHCHSVTAKP